jgi:Lon protease-like protein
MMIPLFVGRSASLAAIEAALATDDHELVLFTQRDPDVDLPRTDDLYGTGTAASVAQIITLPDGSFKVMLEGLKRVHVENIADVQNDCIFVKASNIEETPVTAAGQQRLIELMQKYERWARFRETPLVPFPRYDYQSAPASGLIDQIVIYLDAPVSDRQSCLDTTSVDKRIELLHTILDNNFAAHNVELSRFESTWRDQPQLGDKAPDREQLKEIEQLKILLNEVPHAQLHSFAVPENLKAIYPRVAYASCQDPHEDGHLYFTTGLGEYAGYELAVLTRSDESWPTNLLNNVVQSEALKSLKLLEQLDENGCAFFMALKVSQDHVLDFLVSKESFFPGKDTCLMVAISITVDECELIDTHELMHRLVKDVHGRFSVPTRESILAK